MSEASPLVTFALFAYNQEALIADAMKAALAQDYSPLEIIVSDDCSSDGTWGVIEAIAAGYRGPHELKIVRNPSNLGIGPHVSKVGLEARGELIVVAAGDDLSVPHRVSCLVEAWIAKGRPEGLLHSAAMQRRRGVDGGVISRGLGADPLNATMDSFVKNHFRALTNGATAAYTKNLFDRFPPLVCPFEDIPLTFRALLLGELVYVDHPLVDYFVGEGNISRALRFKDRARVRRWFGRVQKNIDSMESDYLHYLREAKSTPDSSIIEEFRNVRRRCENAAGLGSSNPFKIIAGMVSYPYDVSFRRWLGFHLGFFGLR